MIVCRIWGGLGNQMFQYAFAYSVAQLSGQSLVLDTSFYQTQGLRQYLLDRFQIDSGQTVGNSDLPSCVGILKNRIVNRAIRISPHFAFRIPRRWTYLKETRFRFNPSVLRRFSGNVYIDGYWQSERYFARTAADIRRQFVPRYKLDSAVLSLLREVESRDSVSVHIRRGDYTRLSRARNSNLYLLGNDYYTESIRLMRARVPTPVFYFFSDEIHWVRDQFGDDPAFEYVQLNTATADTDEMMVMSACRYHIIANSTYSWWGAWLDPRPEKTVLAPGRRFGNDDIVPDGWIRVPC